MLLLTRKTDPKVKPEKSLSLKNFDYPESFNTKKPPLITSMLGGF